MRFALFSATLLAASVTSAAVPVNGWYTSVFGGYTYLPANVSRNRFDLFFSNPTYSNAFNVGGRIGFQNNPIRYELEYTYIQGKTKNFQADHVKQTGVSGNSTANMGMANIYYDFPDVILPTIYPFLGAGIGYAYVQTSLNSTGPFGATFFSENLSSFAYQATAGLTYNFSENFALNASYRYAATSSSGNFGRIFQAQIADAGVVYRFDQCSYS